eukprot:2039351-Pleurochrysis_carterae.AAC.2
MFELALFVLLALREIVRRTDGVILIFGSYPRRSSLACGRASVRAREGAGQRVCACVRAELGMAGLDDSESRADAHSSTFS